MMKHAWVPAVLLLTSCSFGGGPTVHDKHSIELDRTESTRLDLKIGAGELKVSGGASKQLEADFAYNSESLKPTVEHRASGPTSEIAISQPESGGFRFGNTKSEWDVRLNDSVPLDLSTKLGAGQVDMNLGSLSLRSVNMDIGVGEVNVDLRGTPKKSYNVRINGGVGEARVYLPRSVGISASAAGGIGEVKVDGLEKRGDRWINPGHENDPVQINVDAKGGVGAVRIVAQ
ncbi:MAG TPA: toast rack family protein [Vicinamibacterales bacterium]|nr:toast rack family protein [Vicinamibacterales bacterium]